MKKARWGLAVLLFLFALTGCFRAQSLIDGGEEAIGAKTYIDGRLIGKMIRDVDPENDEVYGHMSPWLPTGKHEIKFVSRNGQVLKKNITIKGSTYIHISFEDKKIRFSH